MTSRHTSVSRTVVLSVGISLLAASTAWAQTPAPAQSRESRTGTMLLSTSTFTHLVQRTSAPAFQVAAVREAPRPCLIDQVKFASTVSATATRRIPTQQRTSQGSWASRHKVWTAIIIGASATAGLLAIAPFANWGGWGE